MHNFFIAQEVGAGETSSLLVYTVQELPTFALATVSDGATGGSAAMGPVPTPLEGLIVEPVPEPGTLLLLLGPGMLGMAARFRRRKGGEVSEAR